ncbi:MAG: IspD/TarI family cytidylyltransferase [Acidimicrobiia bacterium]
MPSRAMIVVGAGSSTRFGTNKLMVEVGGRPLIAHTIDAVREYVDVFVVVCRAEVVTRVEKLATGAIVTPGGATRTLSEMAGLAALGAGFDLIGIHDAARPSPEGVTIERLFTIADKTGGAVPVIAPERLIVDKETLRPVPGLARAQTPQVFRGGDLASAYLKAAQSGFEGHDTHEVMERFGEVIVVAVSGDETNVKVTYPADLETISDRLRGPSRT